MGLSLTVHGRSVRAQKCSCSSAWYHGLFRVRMDASSFNLQSNHGIMDEDKHLSESPSSSSSSSSDISADSVASSLSGLTDDATSSSSLDQHAIGPLYEMSTLMEQIPFKRGLSKHFQGKPQSFTSLSNVRCLEDLAKPESPYKKKLKSCKSYGGGLDGHRSYTPKASSKTISKKSSRICFLLLSWILFIFYFF